MSTSAVSSGLHQLTGSPRGNDTAGVNQTLQNAQVLFCKVQRVYQEGTFLVDLNGREHVVESVIPLKQGEVFRGRIVSVGERLILEKMVGNEVSPADSEVGSSAQTLIQQLGKEVTLDIKAFISQHFKVFDEPTWQDLMRMADQSKQPRIILATAVYLKKLGLPVQHELIIGLSEHLSTERQLHPLLKHKALHLELHNAARTGFAQSSAAIEALANYLKEKAEDSLDQSSDVLQEATTHLSTTPHDQVPALDALGSYITPSDFNQAVFQWLMNAQNGGAVGHRLLALPLVVNGKVLELEMSLFDQQPSAVRGGRVQHKVVHFSLQTEALGKVDATINVAVSATDQSVRIQFSSDSESGVSNLAAHNRSLTKQLQGLNCRLDEQSYSVRPASNQNSVIEPIMRLVINSDSISMLV
jgi:hypothetical protein